MNSFIKIPELFLLYLTKKNRMAFKFSKNKKDWCKDKIKTSKIIKFIYFEIY